MKGKKILFLSLALLLPVGVFIFLKMFGKNEFDVPALHQDIAPEPSGCAKTYTTPYTLADSVMNRLRSSGVNDLYLINFSDEPLTRVKDEAPYSEITFVEANTAGMRNDSFMKCVFLLPPEQDIAVIDKNGSIRGYYKSSDREDIDRLLLELEILLKKY